jgi:uncharacterized protein (TIGR00255 family)
MTGFGKAYLKTEAYKLTVIIRSVNGKGLDISMKLPRELVIYERELRNLIKKFVFRGQVSVNVSLELIKVKPKLRIEDLGEVVDQIVFSTKKLGLNISDDLVLNLALRFYHPEPEEENLFTTESFKEMFLGTFKVALKDFLKSRIEEGQNLKRDIENNLSQLENLLETVQNRAQVLIEKAKERLLNKAKQLLQEIETNKVVTQELKFLVEKLDINEEIQRLKSHIELFKKELQKGSPIGKKLEFITQEMLREANTMGNKLPDLFPLNIEMKTAIDKIRQQVANVE